MFCLNYGLIVLSVECRKYLVTKSRKGYICQGTYTTFIHSKGEKDSEYIKHFKSIQLNNILSGSRL